MADNLEIFGETYPNATGIKAKDTNGNTQTFVKPSGTISISTNGTGIDVSTYASANVSVPTGTARTSADLTVSGATVTAPEGLYATAASKTVANGSATAPATISGSSATVSTGTNTLTLSKTVSVTPTVSAGYVSSGTAGNSSVSLTANVTTKGAATITPSTTQQTIASGTYLTGTQTIDAMPSGTAGTPTATKGTVSNHSITVTPSVTNTTGYITGGTKTGTAVTVSASELVSGSETKTINGTYDVTNLAELIVNVASTASLKYETGTFTLTSDIQGAATRSISSVNYNIITHSLGVAPKFIYIWTEDYSTESPPSADLNFGYVYFVDIVDMQQQFSSSAFGDYPLYATFWMSAAGKVGVQNVTSTAYAPQVKPTSTEFYLYKRANNQYWRAGVTYHYFISEAWWTT